VSRFIPQFCLCLVFALLLGFGISLRAEEGIPESLENNSPGLLSLDEAIQLGLQNYEKIKMSQSDVEAARGEKWQALSNVLPNVSGSYQYNRNVKKPSIFFETGKVPVGFDNVHEFDVNFNQPLTRFGGLIAGVKAGNRAYESSVFADAQTHADVIFEVRQAYYTGILSQEQMKVAKESLDEATDIRKREELRFKVGEIPEFDFNRAVLDEENKKAQLMEAEGNFLIAFKTLRRIIGYQPDQKLSLADSLEKFVRSIPDGKAVDQFEKSNPAVQSLQKLAESREESRKAARAHFFPLFNFFTTYQAVGQSSAHFFPSSQEYFNALSLGLNVDVPVFDGMLTVGKYKTAEAEASRATWQKQYTENNLRLSLDQALIEARVNLAKKKTDEKSVGLAHTLYGQAELRFQNGILSYIDLKDIKNQQELAQLRYLNSLYDYVLSLAKIEQIVGSSISEE